MDSKISFPNNTCRDSYYKENLFIKNVLQGNPIRCHELFRMERHVFIKFCQTLRRQKLLQVTIEEQMAIFLITIGHNERNRMLQARFQHSGETISRHFNNVLKTIVIYSMSNIVLPPFDQVPNQIRNKFKYWPSRYAHNICLYPNIY